MAWEIKNLRDLSEYERLEAGRVLVEAMAHVPHAWPDLRAAMAEVSEFLGDPTRIAFAALEDGRVRGWIGALRHSKFAWELHPLVVDPAHQRKGWGSRLLEALEKAAREAGVITIWLGADDEFGGTNLYGTDLYPDVLGRLQKLAATSGHPFTFYQRHGYVVSGVLPNVNGFGKHDILMTKRL